MKKHSYKILFIVMFVGIIALQFVYNFNFRIQPPSKEWGKEVLVSKGNVKNYPKIISYENGYIISHDDGDKIKVLLIDKLGNKLKEKVFPAEDTFVRNINLLTDGNSIYVNWLISKNGKGIMESLKLDKNLNQLDKGEEIGVVDTNQIGENVLILALNDNIKLLDFSTGKSTTVKSDDAGLGSLLTGTRIKDEYIITYYVDNSNDFKMIKLNNESAPQVKTIGKISKAIGVTYTYAATASDGKYVYELIEQRYKGEYGIVLSAVFPVEGGNLTVNEINVNGMRFLYNPTSVSSGDEARFYLAAQRPFKNKEVHFDIIDFAMKDRKIINQSFISRDSKPSAMPASSGEAAVFRTYFDKDSYNIYMSSQASEYKNANNGVKNFETKLAALDTIEGVVNSITYIIFAGMKIIFVGAICITPLLFLGLKMKEVNKKRYFAAASVLTVLVKINSYMGLFYDFYGQMLPHILSSRITGILINLIISALVFSWGYRKYSKDTDAIVFGSFMIALLTDLLLTQMIFVPFIS